MVFLDKMAHLVKEVFLNLKMVEQKEPALLHLLLLHGMLLIGILIMIAVEVVEINMLHKDLIHLLGYV